MIAIESFRRFRFKDILAIMILVALWWLLSQITINILAFDPQITYIISLIIITLLMSFAVHLVRKAGSATLFYLIGSIITLNVNDIGITGLDKVIVFLFAGIIFELIFLIFKIEIKNIQIDIIAGTAISTAFIPILMVIILSITTALNMSTSAINLILLSFFIGIIGSIISFIIWYNLKTTKLVLKFEYT
ncbi:MAG: hypothetical protein ABIH25_05255 [Candidatus Woesearchaeota archaeon]